MYSARRSARTRESTRGLYGLVVPAAACSLTIRSAKIVTTIVLVSTARMVGVSMIAIVVELLRVKGFPNAGQLWLASPRVRVGVASRVYPAGCVRRVRQRVRPPHGYGYTLSSGRGSPDISAISTAIWRDMAGYSGYTEINEMCADAGLLGILKAKSVESRCRLLAGNRE